MIWEKDEREDKGKSILLRNDTTTLAQISFFVFLLFTLFFWLFLLFLTGFYENPFDGINWSKLNLSKFNIVSYSVLIIGIINLLIIFLMLIGFIKRYTIIFDVVTNEVQILVRGKTKEIINLQHIDLLRYYVVTGSGSSDEINIQFLKDGVIHKKIRISSEDASKTTFKHFIQNLTIPIETRRLGTGSVFVPFDRDKDLAK